MSLTALIALGLAKEIPLLEDVLYIGADRGALVLAEKGIAMDLAIGDFDSVSRPEMERIEASSKKVIRLNPVKDDTDSEAALNQALAIGCTRVYFCGALGKRIDHTLVNLALCMKHPGTVSILEPDQCIEAFGPGRYAIRKDGYRYLSVFTDDTAVVSLENVQYPLKERTITRADIYAVSNEIIGDEGIVTVHAGKILLVRCSG